MEAHVHAIAVEGGMNSGIFGVELPQLSRESGPKQNKAGF